VQTPPRVSREQRPTHAPQQRPKRRRSVLTGAELTVLALVALLGLVTLAGVYVYLTRTAPPPGATTTVVPLPLTQPITQPLSPASPQNPVQ
jgi:hypothetical protein